MAKHYLLLQPVKKVGNTVRKFENTPVKDDYQNPLQIKMIVSLTRKPGEKVAVMMYNDSLVYFVVTGLHS